MNNDRPNITNNFNAPIGQYIANVQSMSVSIDKDGTVHVANIENAQPKQHRKKQTHTRQNTTKQSTTPIPYTVHYTNHSSSRNNRLQKLMQGLQQLNWIVEPHTADNFYNLFEGQPCECNIRWTKQLNKATIYYFLQELLRCPHIKTPTGCSAYSLMVNQFHYSKVCSDKTRVTEDSKAKIKLLLSFLDPQKTLPTKTEDFTAEPVTDHYNYLNDGLHATKDLRSRIE